MKPRPFGLALAATAAIGILAASVVARVRHESRPILPPTAEQAFARQLSKRVSSDHFMRRKLNGPYVKRLLDIANSGGTGSSEAFSGLITLQHTPYRAEILRVAVRVAEREKHSAAFRAITLLEVWGDPRWRPLAEAQAQEGGEWGELFRSVLRESER